jgi:hypothetical protein
MAKKVTKKKPDVEIKVRNLNKVMKDGKKCSYSHHGGHFWIFGSALAMVLSYERGASIIYAILHGILSWFYVLFRAMQVWGWF